MSIKVIKRDGIIVDFDIQRIINAIYKANLETNELVAENIEEFKEIATIKKIISNINQWCADETELSVEKIQDTVEQSLIKYGLDKTAKAYILYRNKRSNVREASSYIANTIAEFTYKDANENEDARSNANINADTSAGTMLYYGSETSKWFARTKMIKPHLSKLHDEGYLHIHDLDYYAIGTCNCLQIPIDKLLANGFNTGHGYVRSPSNIRTAASLACIALQSNQAEMYGGQSLPSLDFALAPYVKKTFIKELIKLLEIHIEDTKCLSDIEKDLEEYSKNHSVLDCKESIFNIIVRSKLFHNILYHYIELANKRTDKETYQAMEALIHNFCTMHSRAGNQVPFSSINFGMDTTPEGRMVSKNLMLAQESGLGNGETAVFPITIMSLMEGYNLNPSDPNYDLFKLSCRVSAKRLYPNWNYVGSTYNKKYFKEGNPDTIVSVMGILTGNEYVRVSINGEHAKIVSIKELIDNIYSENKFIKAANVENTFYSEVDNLEIFDGYTITKVKKILKWMDCTKTKWYRLHLKDRFGILKHQIDCTYDHPWRIKTKISDVHFKRTLTEDIKKLVDNDTLCIMDGDKLWYISKVEEIEPIRVGYDFETESDMFAISGVDLSLPLYNYNENTFLDTYVVSHNCRTRVIGNTWNPERETTSGRGNLSFVTINLPLLAIESNHDVDTFFSKLDSMMGYAEEVLMDRYKIQANKKAKNFPFLVMQGLMMDGEKLDPEDRLGDTIRNGTLSIGFCGLSECLKALVGKHHGESQEAQELGLRIIKHMRKRMDNKAEDTKYNWSLFATPAESVAGRFCNCIKKKYGELEGISDKEYLTNSIHVDVSYECSMTHKVNIEAPYHELCNAG